MNDNGDYLGQWRLPTSAKAIKDKISELGLNSGTLTFEEGSMAQWLYSELRKHVGKVIVCNPKENRLVSRNPNKNDYEDTKRLCRLLRVGELKEVYHSPEKSRAVFKATVQEYDGPAKSLETVKSCKR
jgi:hypothetical protein